MPFSKAIKFPIFVYGKTNIHNAKKGLISISPEFLRAGILNIGQQILGYQPKNAVTVFNIIGKMNINGKTLCFYLALDPNDPELKYTVYHQKDVGMQKAYESTPFMVKVKSDAAAKKALRLVGLLAEKLGAQKKEEPEVVDYVGEFAYKTTKQLFDQGFIKASKEKKVDFSKF